MADHSSPPTPAHGRFDRATVRQRIALVVIVLALSWGAVRLWRAVFPETVVTKAVDARKLFLAGDLAGLYAMAPESERNAYRLTDAQLRELSEKFLKPKLAGVRFIRTTGPDIAAGLGEGSERFELALPGGRTLPYVFTAVRTDAGIRVPFRTALLSAWFLDRAKTASGEEWSKLRFQSWIDGIERDGPLLRSLGVPGLVEQKPGGKLGDWNATLEGLYKFREQTTGG